MRRYARPIVVAGPVALVRLTKHSRRFTGGAAFVAASASIACGSSPAAPSTPTVQGSSVSVTPTAGPTSAPVPTPNPAPAPSVPTAPQTSMRFGFDTKAIQQGRSLGVPVSYGTTWAGSWNQKYGWGDVEREVQQARSAGVTPVIPWWYWGDDISPSCVESGCNDRYQGVHKDRATWNRLSSELADLMARAGGAGSIVVIEPEFNKNGIEKTEAFDGYLVEQASIFHARGVQVVIAFGNWGRSEWTRFDRAVAAADMLGTMSLLSSVRDQATYLSGASSLLTAAQYYQSTFGKPTLMYDVGFSSYPEPSYETNQDTVVAEIFRRMPEFQAAGVRGMIWRMLSDDPGFDTNNYHGIAERYWGLLHSDGKPKTAFRWFTTNAATMPN